VVLGRQFVEPCAHPRYDAVAARAADHQAGPDDFEQFTLCDRAVAVFDEREQQVECSRSDTGGRAGDEQLSLGWADFYWSEPMRIHSRILRWLE